MRLARVIALSAALAVVPACAGVRQAAAPFAAATTLDQQAYALIGAYAAVLESAAALVRDPAFPAAAKRALAQAEARATPAVELVKIAAIAHARAKDGKSAEALAQAILDAQAPMAAFAAAAGGR